MRLGRILDSVNIIKMNGFRDYNIKSVTHISSEVMSNGLFICIKGANYNGNNFIDEVVKKGAKCIVTEDDVVVTGVAVIVVDDVRKAMSIIAKNFYYKCCDKLNIIGLIGTSGKTTTSTIIAQMLSKSGVRTGVIGTNGIYIDNIRQDNKFTTPDPLELHYVFYQMKMLGISTVVMEVSAQAIALKKMYGIKLKIGVFTNISTEHLDFFGSMENYAKCKMNYFNKINMDEAVVNIDDFFGRELAYKVDFPCVSYGINEPANVFAVNIESDLNGLKFVANVFDDIISVDSKFVGIYNVYNLLAAISVVKMLGVDAKKISQNVSALDLIPGRFNVFPYKSSNIIVDFAHTVDSIENLLSVIKINSKGRIISLFGCVGYSDREKRIAMTEVVSKYSDMAILTTDNRGTTSFQEIVEDMLCGIGSCEYEIIEDRKSAIKFAVEKLQKNDILVLIGKGAENFQKIEDERIPYSDIDCVREIIGI